MSDVSSKLTDVKDQVLVKSIEGGLRIQLVDKESNQMFPIGSAELTPQAKEILQVICDTMRDRSTKFAIEGHTDARPYPSDYYTNWELSTERASTARIELAQRYTGRQDIADYRVRRYPAPHQRRPLRPEKQNDQYTAH